MKDRRVTRQNDMPRDARRNRDVRIHDLYGLKARSDVLSHNFSHIHFTTSKKGRGRSPQQRGQSCKTIFFRNLKMHVFLNNSIKYAWISLKPSQHTFFCPDDSNEGSQPYTCIKSIHIRIFIKRKK